MKNFRKLLLIAITFFIGFVNGYSSFENVSKDENKKGGIKAEIKEYISHHLKDSHSYSITSYLDEESGKKVYIELPLPVILYDQGLKFFWSSEFKHGKTTVSSGENYYKLNYHDNRIYKTDRLGTIDYDEKHHPLNHKANRFFNNKKCCHNYACCNFNVFIVFRTSKIVCYKQRHFKRNGQVL